MPLTSARTALKKYFGYDSFHPTQEKAISAVLAGKNTLVLMPTGGGKSVCYQVPALVKAGTAIVVSPLIALMKDQVDGLQAMGIAADYLNSSLDAREQASIIERAKKGEIKLLYVSAERLATPSFFQLLKQMEISVFAIDEAHCISSWGHDFRPEYAQLSNLTRSFPSIPILALTATADFTTRQDILTQLELPDPVVLIDSFDRPNISLSVQLGIDRMTKIQKFLQERQSQPGIVYCLSRKTTEEVAQKLQQAGFSAASYHAGMSSAERSRVQRSFIKDKTQIICATIAFGMGIDKLNVRWVIHYNLPKNIEGYYQEIGRSGRDGAPADALLLYTYRDYQTLKKFCTDSSRTELQLAKLERMKEFAESVICRRQVLMHYFGEPYVKKCHNCDVCESKLATFDGSAIVHFVLQALTDSTQPITTKELASLIANASLGVSFAESHFYLSQLKNAGIITQLFDKQQQLSLTRHGKKVLAERKKVSLVTLDTFIEKRETAADTIKPKRRKPRSSEYHSPIFEALRQKRAEVSQAQKLPAYMIFSDKTLLEMAHEKPATKAQMLAISGVGEVKWEKYGVKFLEVIQQ